MKTKINDSDPRLTAYALGELSLQEADEMAKLIEADQSLQSEVDSIQDVSQLLSAGLGAETHYKLKPEQRAKVYQSGNVSTLSVVPSGEKKQWLRSLVVIAGAAAVVTLSFVALKNTDARNSHAGGDVFADAEVEMYGENPRIQANNSAWVPSSGEASAHGQSHGGGVVVEPDAVPSPERENQKNLEQSENGWESRAQSAMTRIPLSAADYSWGWIQDWARKGGEARLSSELVRVEEIINHFSYHEPADMMVDQVQVGVSLVQCPWDSSHQIAVILVKNTGMEPSDVAQVEAGLTFSENVARYRLLGHKNPNTGNYAKYAPAVTELAPGQSHLVIYELEMEPDFTPSADVGGDAVTLSVRSISAGETESQMTEKSLNILFSDVTWEVAPQDTQFAILLATWAQGITENAQSDLDAMITKFKALNDVTDQQFDALEIMQKSRK